MTRAPSHLTRPSLAGTPPECTWKSGTSTRGVTCPACTCTCLFCVEKQQVSCFLPIAVTNCPPTFSPLEGYQYHKPSRLSKLLSWNRPSWTGLYHESIRGHDPEDLDIVNMSQAGKSSHTPSSSFTLSCVSGVVENFPISPHSPITTLFDHKVESGLTPPSQKLPSSSASRPKSLGPHCCRSGVGRRR